MNPADLCEINGLWKSSDNKIVRITRERCFYEGGAGAGYPAGVAIVSAYSISGPADDFDTAEFLYAVVPYRDMYVFLYTADLLLERDRNTINTPWGKWANYLKTQYIGKYMVVNWSYIRRW